MGLQSAAGHRRSPGFLWDQFKLPRLTADYWGVLKVICGHCGLWGNCVLLRITKGPLEIPRATLKMVKGKLGAAQG